MVSRNSHRWATVGVCGFLVAIVFFVFGQTLGHQFVNYDDQDYVTDNPWVTKGLTLDGMIWAFTHVYSANWHPLTWISHMLDCQLYGLNPAGHHFTNVLLHAATSVLLFLFLKQMTGFLWRSGFVAALFAVHPQHVESVAWVSERKDVLSGLYFMLTLGAYVRYVRSRPLSLGRYSLVVLCFALGLMSKPMLVTLPFVLLLLDYWPLARMTSPSGKENQGAVFRGLVLEKIPFFLLSASSCAVTMMAQTEAMVDTAKLPMFARLGNAIVSYAAYLKQMFWPAGLAAFYPYPSNGQTGGLIILAFAFLASLSLGVFVVRKRHPWLLVGWLWFLGMLVPVIGFLQVGMQSRADRYTYLPEIGILLMLVWTVSALPGSWRLLTTGASVALIGTLAIAARVQASYWRNSVTLWTHATECTEQNSAAWGNLGSGLLEIGNATASISCLRSALSIDSSDYRAQDNLGSALLETGQTAAAIDSHRKALQINPTYDKALNNLGFALTQAHRPEEAIPVLEKAIELRPMYPKAEINLGNALLQLKRVPEAIHRYRNAIRISPAQEKGHYNLGNALILAGRAREAVPYLETALRLQPRYVRAMERLAWVRATSPDASLRNGPEALKLADQANQISGGNVPRNLCTLAASYAETGRFPDAVQTARKALQLAEAQSNSPLADALREHLKSYESNAPFRDAGLTSGK